MNDILQLLDPAPSVQTHFNDIHKICTETLKRSFEADTLPRMATSLVFVSDLADWATLVGPQPEVELYKRAEHEYVASLFNVSQGQYSNAFKGLRLVLELILQGVYLSVNIIELKQWLGNSADTNWSNLMNPDTGPLSVRFCDAFFPALRDHAKDFSRMAGTLYRELSETIHGNVPLHIPLPRAFDFDENAFCLWHEKAKTIRMITMFCLSTRYLLSQTEVQRRPLEQSILDQLGYIESIRTVLGGPAGK